MEYYAGFQKNIYILNIKKNHRFQKSLCVYCGSMHLCVDVTTSDVGVSVWRVCLHCVCPGCIFVVYVSFL